MDSYLDGLPSDLSLRGYRQSGDNLRARGLTGALPRGTGQIIGLGSVAYGVEPTGDLGEGVDVPAIISGQAGYGRGDSYTPLPGVLPSKDHLDYVQKFSTAGLLAIGFLMLLVLGILRPRRAFNYLARGAQHHAGVA
jgi:hypothetical protein